MFGHEEKRLDQKGKVNFKVLLSGQQTIKICILTNISSNKGNQGMKFDQLIAYKMRKNFLEKSYTEYGGGPIPRPFLKYQN